MKKVRTKHSINNFFPEDWDIESILGSDKKMRFMYDMGKFDTCMLVNDGSEYNTKCLGKVIRTPNPIISLFKCFVPMVQSYWRNSGGTGWISSMYIIDIEEGRGRLGLSTEDGLFELEYLVGGGTVKLGKTDSEYGFGRHFKEHQIKNLCDLIYKALYYSIEMSSVPLHSVEYHLSQTVWDGESAGNRGNTYYAGLCEASYENGVQGFDYEGEKVEGEYVLVFLEDS